MTIIPQLVQLSTDMTLAKQTEYLRQARGGYRVQMRLITTDKLIALCTKGLKTLMKKVSIRPGTEDDEDGPTAEVRSGGCVNDGSHILDQAVLDF